MYDKEAAGKRIQDYRKLKNITQEELATNLHISRSKISSWETARRDICMTDAIQLCEQLNISLNTLFNPKEINSREFYTLAYNFFHNINVSYKEKEQILKKILKFWTDEEIKELLDES